MHLITADGYSQDAAPHGAGLPESGETGLLLAASAPLLWPASQPCPLPPAPAGLCEWQVDICPLWENFPR